MIRVHDLPDQIGTDGPRTLLYCPRCQGEFSANRGDYFMAEPRTPLRCSCSPGRPALRLVTKRTVYEEVHS